MKAKKLLALVLIFLPILSWADSSSQPVPLLLTHTRPQQVWIIRNKSHQPILLDRIKKDPGASAGFASVLSSHAYSALIIDQPFLLSCHEYPAGSYLDCQKVLELVRMHNETIFTSTTGHIQAGTYWLAENTYFLVVYFHLRLLGTWVPDSG